MSDRPTIAASNPLSPLSATVSSRRGVFRLLALTCAAILLLYARSLVSPVVFYDDFQILAQSWTWERARDGLWVPQNEHAMPLGRLLAFALEKGAGRLPNLPIVTCLFGPLSLLLGLALIYVFVRREMGHPLYALLAVVLFGVTTVYQQAVWWFAASFAILSLDTMLLGLLAAQRWRQTGRGFYLDLTVLACALAPGWFAIGVLAGPLCFLYLLTPEKKRGLSRSTRYWTLLPLLGTTLFLAISLPRTAQTIMHLGHYGDQTAVQAFDPLIGLGYTARSIVDNLLLGLVGVAGVALPLACVVPLLIAALVLGAWWWWQAIDRRLMLLGLGLIGSGYLLVYSARSAWLYEQMVTPTFSRYHMFPQLGLVLFFCGGLSGRAGRWFALAEDGTLSEGQRRILLALIGVCFAVNLPRGLIAGSPTGWHPIQGVREQQAVLRRIEEVDALCRKHRIRAADARAVLETLDIPYAIDKINGWEFLRGSDDPRPLSPEEIRRILGASPPEEPSPTP